MADIINQSSTIFDYPDTPSTSLLQLQTVPSQPLPSDLSTATGLLAPSFASATRLDHFPEEIYDLSESSHLVRFLKALIGDAGAGQLRKRQLIARLQATLTSTYFYDLDRFYGALFGAQRGISGALPMDPYEGTATSDGWDDVDSFDALFRERVIKLAKAITLGGTVLGLQAMAEALTDVECDVYEIWALIDWQGATVAATTWTAVEGTFGTWSSIEGTTWDDIEGRVIYGNLGLDLRNEIVIRPKKTYDSSPDGQRQLAEDTWGILRVLNVLKPADTVITVNTEGVALHHKVAIGSLVADSDYWEISARVLPKQTVKNWYTAIDKAYDGRANPQGIDSAQPRPAFTSAQGQQWSYVGNVVSAKASSEKSNREYDTVHFPDKTTKTYLPSYALIDLKTAAAGRVANDGVTVSAPYSGPRKTVPTHG
jgi:hypothetical protein